MRVQRRKRPPRRAVRAVIGEAGPIDRAKRARADDAVADRFDAVETGASLREARTLLRRSLEDAAHDLRIRRVYLLAIEEGRLEDLPGDAYRAGFLRAYGNYLGLDGARLAEEFKEARDASGKPDALQVFSPVDEGRLPTRSIFLVAALLAVAVYGVWYFVSGSGGEPVERVAAVPDRLAVPPDGEPAATEPAPVVTPPAADPAPPPPEPEAPDEDGENGGETVQAAVGAPEPATPPVEPAAPAEEETVPESAGEAPPVPDANQAVPPVETAETPLTAPARPAGGGPGAARETPAAGVRDEPAAPRIVLRAAAESWIEIGAEGERPVYSGLLRAGQSYTVPERPGLRMVTGNAGGLDILIDGEAIPRLGPPGAVIRDIDLDPDSLRDRAGR